MPYLELQFEEESKSWQMYQTDQQLKPRKQGLFHAWLQGLNIYAQFMVDTLDASVTEYVDSTSNPSVHEPYYTRSL